MVSSYLYHCTNRLFVHAADVDDQLAEVFNTVGTVKRISVPKRKDSEISRGFGFIDYDTKEEMEKAVAELDGYVMDGRELSVSVSLPKEQLPKRPSECPTFR